MQLYRDSSRANARACYDKAKWWLVGGGSARQGTRVVFPAATRSEKVTKATSAAALEPAGQGKNESSKRRRRRRRLTPADIANKRDTRR